MLSSEEYEKKYLSLPIAGKVSGEDEEHKEGDSEFKPLGVGSPIPSIWDHTCGCDRCRIIRIKRRKAFKFSQSKCERCGKLHTSIYTLCKECRSK